MKKTLAAGFFLVMLAVMGAGCTAQTNVDVSGAMMKKEGENMMKDDSSMMNKDEAMKGGSGKMLDDGSVKVGVDINVDTGAMMKKNDGATMKKDPSMTAKGTYETYSADKLALAQNGKVVLFFKASWCPTCKAVDADILAHLNAIPSGAHILIVDYDTSSDLKKKYGVTYQHTFVQVDAEGAMLKKWSGSPTLASLVAEIK